MGGREGHRLTAGGKTMMEIGIVALWLAQLHVMPASHIGVQVRVSFFPPISLPANMLWKAAEDSPGSQPLATHVGVLHTAPLVCSTSFPSLQISVVETHLFLA